MAPHESTSSSFMKSLFTGDIAQEIIFPYPMPDAEELENIHLILQAWREFADDNIDARQIDRDKKIPKEVSDGMKELGFFGMSIPEEYGGGGMSKTGYARIFEEICTRDASIATSLGAHLSIGTNGLLMYGNEKQKQKYLPKLASGEWTACFALTEPGAGSDAAGIQTFAKLNEAKTEFILNGGKIWITNGGTADLATVFAKTDVHEKGEVRQKITAFLVETAWEGVSHGKPEDKLGIRGSNTASLNFDNVRVPVENVLGPVGKGFKIAMEVLNTGRLSLAAGCVGGCKALIHKSIDYARNRKQFGQPIAEFEMIQNKISRMVANTYAAESMVYLTAGLADRKVVDYSLESAICKVAASEILWDTVNETMQIAGGLGYSAEYEYERFMRDARINLIFEGTNEILRAFVALSGMQGPGEYLKKIGKALRDPIKGFGLLTEFAVHKVKDRVIHDSLKNTDPRLKEQVDKFNDYAAELKQVVEKVLMKYGKEIIHREFILERIANIAIDLFGIAAVISRIDTRMKADKPVDQELPPMRLFCDMAWRRIRRNLRQIDNNSDAVRKEIVAHAYELNRFPFEVLDF